MVEGFEKFEQCLDAFGLPEMYLWFKKVDKIAHSMEMNVNELINEVEKTRELLKKNPGDRNMQVSVFHTPPSCAWPLFV